MTRDELRDTVRTVINELWDEARKPQGESRPFYALSKAGDTIIALFDEAAAWVPVTSETMPPMEDDIVVLVVYSWGVRAHMAMDLTDEEIAAAGCHWCRLPVRPKGMHE